MRRAILAQDQNDLGHLARHMTDLMHKVLQSGFAPGPKRADWLPAVDICELKDRYEILVELAGVRREDIEVYTENRYLTVTGCRHDPTSHEKIALHQMEIEQGRFRRRVLLPPDANEAGVAAHLHDGLLRIEVPKQPAGA